MRRISRASAGISSRRTYTKPDPQGERSHFCAPHASRSTGVARTSTGIWPRAWIASTTSRVPVIRVTRDSLPNGEVTGSLCYPSEFNPPMTLYIENAGTGDRIQFSIPENQNVYTVLVPNGTYYAYAWAPGYNLEGAYTDGSSLMKSFVVIGGQTTANINLCDWSPVSHTRGE